MATKDWNDEWDMENSEVKEMIESFERMQNCSHAWVPITGPDRELFSEDAEECTLCGGVQIKVTEREFNQFRDALEEGRVGTEEN